MTQPTSADIDAQLHATARENFYLFARLSFAELKGEPLMDNWHLHAMARQLEHVEAGEMTRLLISMPPRTMKSDMTSIFFPAWLLGRDPGCKIICASYGQNLSNDFASAMRTLMRSPAYCRIFPKTRIDPLRSSVEDIRTTKGGYRLSTSVGGTLTGRGADVIIIDDPLKADEAHWDAARDAMHSWYRRTLLSRLNHPATGRIVVVSQRLHQDDLPGVLVEEGDWEELILPLVEWERRKIEGFQGRILQREPGEILHPERFPADWIERQRERMGERDFESQYNQRPMPPGGALFKLEWLKRYKETPESHRIQSVIQSWDTAYDVQASNDYSVCTTWALCGDCYYLLDVFRDRLEFPALQKKVEDLRDEWNASLVVVENMGSGKSLAQNIVKERSCHWLKPLNPQGSKQHRASQQTPKVEGGKIFVPEQADWLLVFEKELVTFPHGKFDDQVDSLTQFLAAIDKSAHLFNLIEGARSFLQSEGKVGR